MKNQNTKPDLFSTWPVLELKKRLSFENKLRLLFGAAVMTVFITAGVIYVAYLIVEFIC
jgi:hypothetical protein